MRLICRSFSVCKSKPWIQECLEYSSNLMFFCFCFWYYVVNISIWCKDFSALSEYSQLPLFHMPVSITKIILRFFFCWKVGETGNCGIPVISWYTHLLLIYFFIFKSKLISFVDNAWSVFVECGWQSYALELIRSHGI